MVSPSQAEIKAAKRARMTTKLLSWYSAVWPLPRQPHHPQVPQLRLRCSWKSDAE